MGRQGAGQKAYRALDLLSGLYEPEVRAALERHGFDDAELKRGWQLLEAYARARRADAPPASAANALVAELDAWENQWFVVGDAALKHAFPKAHAWLFRNLSRTQGFEVVISVSSFIERVRKLSSARGLAEQGKQARERLRRRGLTDKLLTETEALVKRIQSPKGSPRDLRDPALERQAEDAVWDYYLEWSGIARAVLRDKRLLAHIGFGKVGRPRKRPA